MPPQRENLCIIGTLFLFCHPSLIVAGSTCDTRGTPVCDGDGNRGGEDSNLGWHRPHLPLRMARGKSSWVDMLVSIGIGTKIAGSGVGRVNSVDICVESTIDVLNSSPSGVAKETSRCNEMGSTYKVGGCIECEFEEVMGYIEGGFEEVRGCTDGRFKKVGGYINGRSEEVGSYTEGGFKKVGGCIDDGFEEVRGCFDDGSKRVGGCTDDGSEEMSAYTNCGDKEVRGYNDIDIDKVIG